MADSEWRFCLAAPQRTADGFTVTSIPIISWLDRLASERTVTLTLNEPWELTGSVPSDEPTINLPYPNFDDEAYMAEGVRAVLGFRKGFGESQFTPAAHGIVLDLRDVASNDTARSIFSALDGWAYLFSRPCVLPDGRFPGDFGINFYERPLGLIAAELLLHTIQYHGQCFIDGGNLWGGTGYWAPSGGVIEDTTVVPIWTVEAGTTVGQAWLDLVETGELDIVLTPIYDPTNRPGYLWNFNVYQRAGTWKPEAVFAWDMPGRSVVSMERTRAGRERVNKLRYHNGQGGPPAASLTNAASVAKFGEYHGEEFFPKQKSGTAVLQMAQRHMALVREGPEVLSFDPATGRAPDPITAYTVGDIVTGWASRNFREPVSSYKRVLQIPMTLDDNGTETVNQLIVEPGPAPPVETALEGTDTSTFTSLRVARDKGTRKFTQGKSWGGRY